MRIQTKWVVSNRVVGGEVKGGVGAEVGGEREERVVGGVGFEQLGVDLGEASGA